MSQMEILTRVRNKFIFKTLSDTWRCQCCGVEWAGLVPHPAKLSTDCPIEEIDLQLAAAAAVESPREEQGETLMDAIIDQARTWRQSGDNYTAIQFEHAAAALEHMARRFGASATIWGNVSASSRVSTPANGLDSYHIPQDPAAVSSPIEPPCPDCGLIWQRVGQTDCPLCAAQTAMKAVSDLTIARDELRLQLKTLRADLRAERDQVDELSRLRGARDEKENSPK